MNKELIAKYMEWYFIEDFVLYNDSPISGIVKFDGNDMVSAINKMQEKGDINGFIEMCCEKLQRILNNNYAKNKECKVGHFMPWLCGSPTRFFELLSEALEKRIIGKE
jgi:hypothetical protein